MYCGLYSPLWPAVSTGMEGVECVRGPGEVGVLVDLFCKRQEIKKGMYKKNLTIFVSLHIPNLPIQQQHPRGCVPNTLYHVLLKPHTKL